MGAFFVILPRIRLMITKTKGIVLHNIKYGDASLIVDVFTETMGRVAFLVRIPKTSKGRVKKQYFQPLTLLDLEFDYRQRSSLQHIKDVRIAVPYASIAFDAVKSTLSLFLAEFLYHVTKSEQHNPTLFNYISNSFQWLDGAVEGYANFHLVFMMRLTRFVGFYPNLDDYTRGCYFDMREGAFTPVPTLHSDFLSPDDASRVHQLMRMDYETMHLFKLSHNERNRITDLALHYYRLHVPTMPELRSYDVLREVFR